MLKQIMRHVFPWLFALVGFSILVYGVRNCMDAIASEEWPHTEGEVVSSRIVEDSDSDGTSYGAEVVYEYTIDGVDHSSDNVHFGDYKAGWKSHARGIVERYPVGKEVTVYYEPSDHGNAVLEPGTNFVVYFTPVFGSVFLVVGLSIFVYRRKAHRAAE